MPALKKKSAVKKIAPPTKKIILKKTAPPKKKSTASNKIVPGLPLPRPLPSKKTYTVYIGASAFFPASSADGYTDLFQDGRCTVAPNRSLQTPIVVPVGAVLNSISVHYTNTTGTPVLCLFLRLHADRVSPSGEIEMSFITLAPGVLPPDNYLTVTDTSFADGNTIQDRFLHYLDVQGTGDFGAGGRVTVRGVSFTYTY